ncbi:polyhydroxyalkanoate depolymerase [Amaricoccus sp.]|uniref:polyhydroxyalkanoate depolymerase n=1 Tax=Amaricoccus sp. TaxID=1872485 RepID=UPI001B4D582E|nr:polyhydroxyalkanoate depolymerase [Amaricoccus sp.]MBP7000897.1 polyhydroxyalkanoate depolymerase [Amaricoccus sp.]
MLYETYQLNEDLLSPVRRFAQAASRLPGLPGRMRLGSRMAREMAAMWELLSRFRLTHVRPEFGIRSVPSGNAEVAVVEEVALSLPYGNLLHFAKPEVDAPQPKILVIAPLSGHFATLLRNTVATLLRDHDVYITDWANARDVPVSAGSFGVDDYMDYVIRFLEAIGPGAHVLAVCQPCVQTLAVVAVMSEQDHPATPRSMTLMAGPIDTRESPTTVNDLANEKTIDWFRSNVIGRVPWRYKGRGRRVYPGFVQLSAFMAMNMDRHRSAHARLYQHLARGEVDEAARIKEFYDEYFAVLDLTEEFYLETIDRVFQRADLASGEFLYRGRRVNPGAIRRTALLTVEGGRDDICALGQTAAAHELCASLRPHLRRHHLQANVGHYGVFSGRRWEQEIYPVVRNMILAME